MRSLVLATLMLGCAGASSAPEAPRPVQPTSPAAPEAAAADAGAAAPGDAATTGPVTVTFAAEDGLEVTADLYRATADPKTPFIVLFHQAGWSRGEYREIAPILNEGGFNVMAVDQRSGGVVNGVVNETHRRAVQRGLGTEYVDALPDLRAALRHARAEYAQGLLLAWGSSYSAALVLWLAGEEPDLADGALAFAPGEYFERAGKPKTWIRDAAAKIHEPVFITSARAEKDQWMPIYRAIPSKTKGFFIPEAAGQHGSRALWARFPEHEEYWDAVGGFLLAFLQAPR